MSPKNYARKLAEEIVKNPIRTPIITQRLASEVVTLYQFIDHLSEVLRKKYESLSDQDANHWQEVNGTEVSLMLSKFKERL